MPNCQQINACPPDPEFPAPPPTPPQQTNDSQFIVVCVPGTKPTFSPPLTQGYYVVGGDLVIRAGVISADTKLEANNLALQSLNDLKSNATCPSIVCCNCGTPATIVGYTPGMFTYNASAFIIGDGTVESITPSGGNYFIGSTITGDFPGIPGEFGYAFLNGVWYYYASNGQTNGTLTPLGVQAGIACYTTLGPSEATPFTLRFYTNPLIMTYGPEWDGKFNYQDDLSLGFCADQLFLCTQIDGMGVVNPVVSFDGVSTYTFTIYTLFPFTNTLNNVVPAIILWQGTSSTPFGIYNLRAGNGIIDPAYGGGVAPIVFTGPATLTIVPA